MGADPNAVLSQAVDDARQLVADSYDPVALRLADHVLELHDSLMKGGPLPAAWTTAPNGRVRG